MLIALAYPSSTQSDKTAPTHDTANSARSETFHQNNVGTCQDPAMRDPAVSATRVR